MSEYDQMVGHQVNSSGNCVIEGCPCRGWSAQEGVRAAKEESMNTNDAVSALKEFGEVVERIPSVTKDEIIRQDERERLQEIRAASHQPAARGGGDEWRVGNSSIHGYKIYNAQGREVVASIYRKEDADQIVGEHNAVVFAVRSGSNWTLEDWQNWRTFHAQRPATPSTSAG